jgi:hypothetical protein
LPFCRFVGLGCRLCIILFCVFDVIDVFDGCLWRLLRNQRAMAT